MKYSLWIVPPETVFSQLRDVIRSLSEKYGGLQFQPHMTLLGGFEGELEEVRSRVAEVIDRTPQFPLHFGPVSFSTTHFQSVFVRINSSAPLMQLNLDLKNVLGAPNDVFMPHMSLMYGDHDMVTRETIAAEVKIDVGVFPANTVVMVPATLEPSEWQTVASFTLAEK